MQGTSRSVHHRIARTPATITAATLLAVYAVSTLLYLALGASFVIGIATLVTLVVPLVAGLYYSESWRPRWPTQQLVERVRAGSNPIGVAYGTMLVSVCPVAVLFNWVGFEGDSNFPPTVVVVFALCCVLGALFGPKHLAVDSSGIFVQRAYGWQCIPWRAVRSVALGDDKRTIVITVRRAGEQRVWIAKDSPLDPTLLLENILRFQPPKDGFDPASPRFTPLDRNGRDRDRWLADVRALVTQNSFREAPITIDDLRLLLEHDDTPNERRVAAAAALSAHDASAPERIRVAIAACDDRALARELEAITVGLTVAESQRR